MALYSFRLICSIEVYELWKSDGTTAGTVLVKDIAPGAMSSFPQSLYAMGSTLYFSASSESFGSS